MRILLLNICLLLGLFLWPGFVPEAQAQAPDSRDIDSSQSGISTVNQSIGDSLVLDSLLVDSLFCDSIQNAVINDSLTADSISGLSGVLADTAWISRDILQEGTWLMRYADTIRERFGKSPVLVIVLNVITIYFIISLVVLLIIILANRTRMEKEAALKEFLLEKYQLLLMDYLFDEEKRDESFEELAQVANNRFRRQVLIDQMIDLSVNLKGEIKGEIQKLYLRLGLKRDSLHKAYSSHWHNNVKGFRELSFMNIREANDRIVAALNSKNEIVRMEAQIAMVSLSDEHHYEFLDLLEKPFSLWEQVTLHELLVQHDLKVPPFKQWFHSENLTVLLFAVEMTAWFKQKDVAKELYMLFDHENDAIRKAAYLACGEIELADSVSPMRDHYFGENYDNKMAILHTFSRVPDEAYLTFLKEVLDTEEDVQLQIQATKAMENTGEPGISMLIKLMKSKSEYKNYQIIIRHVLDGRIY